MGVLTITSTIIIALITSVFGPILVNKYKQKYSSKPPTIIDENKYDEEIHSQLENISEIIKCDRVWIAQFHNGGNFYPTGKSIKKFSVFYEKTNQKFPLIQYLFQNIPISLFSKTLSILSKEGELNIPTFNKPNNIYELTFFNKEFDSKSLYMVSITDLQNNFIGILKISYIENEHTLTEKEWDFLRKKSNIIGTILSNKK